MATTAHFLIENLRAYAKVFRYGGEEFLLCLPFTELDTGYAMSGRLRKGLEAITINDNTEHMIQVTASCGLALLEHQKPSPTPRNSFTRISENHHNTLNYVFFAKDTDKIKIKRSGQS